MTRAYAACRLLEHGPLSRSEMREITGWPDNSLATLLWNLIDAGMVKRIPGGPHKHYRYALA